MMHNSDALSPRDVELLSAYLDGDLPPKEAEKLKARLRQEVLLRRRLDELRHTVAQLKGLPPVRAPRNFTLTPAMAGIKPRPQPLFNFFRFASAVAAVALVIVVGLDVATTGGRLPVLSAATGQMADETAMLNDAAQRAEAPEEPEAEFAAPMAMEATEEQEEQYLGEADTAAEAPVEEEGLGAEDCVDCPDVSGGVSATSTAEGRHDLSAEATATAKWRETGDGGGIDDETQPGVSPLPTAGEVFWTPFRLVEFSLAGLAIVLVVTTLVLRRQRP
jgi:hypothetical protein